MSKPDKIQSVSVRTTDTNSRSKQYIRAANSTFDNYEGGLKIDTDVFFQARLIDTDEFFQTRLIGTEQTDEE